MATFALRVSLADRPGALGAVASRIGAVRGDVVGIDILERLEGRALDEIVIELPNNDENLVPLLLSEINEVDGAEVKEVHLLGDGVRDGRLGAYETAILLLTEHEPERVLEVLAERACADHDAEWAIVIDTEAGLVLASVGQPPSAAWTTAYIDGRRWQVTSTEGAQPDEVTWVDLSAWDVVMAVGRPGWPFREHERSRLSALAALADARWRDLAEREGRVAHPSQVS